MKTAMNHKPFSQWAAEDFLRQAYINARDLSDDPHTQNGSVLMTNGQPKQVIYGANRLPRGIKIPKRVIASWPKTKKYRWMCHAEASAIHLAALHGAPTWGATLYCPWFACTDCARAIIESGIARVVGHQQMCGKVHPSWAEEIQISNQMLDDAGVIREYIDADLFQGDADYSVLFRGERWVP